VAPVDGSEKTGSHRPTRAAASCNNASRRSQSLDVECPRLPANGPIPLIVDATELSFVGQGEWAALKHRGSGRRGWKKLHLGVDRSGVSLAHTLTEATVDDATTGVGLIEAVAEEVLSVTADGAYDTLAIYEAAGGRGARAIVPPLKTAAVSSRRRPRSRLRDRAIREGKCLGRRQWKKASGYHRQARAKNAFLRYKSMIGGRLRARHAKAQEIEASIACNILNRITEPGRPASLAIGS
jgi:hypothetical protein